MQPQQILLKPYKLYYQDSGSKSQKASESGKITNERENDPNLKREFKDSTLAKITATDLSIASITIDSEKMMRVNPQSKNPKKVVMHFPKQNNISLSRISQHSRCQSIKQSSLHSKDSSSLYLNLSGIRNSENNLFRGLTYDMIRHEEKSDDFSVMDKINKFFNNIFTNNNELPCGCVRVDQEITEVGSTCQRAFDWFKKFHSQKDTELDYSRGETCKVYVMKDQLKHKIRQIELDIKRTVPFNQKFKAGDPKYGDLQRVLRTYSVYDSSIGYIQGMNYIASALVYHCEDWVAFWIMVDIFDLLKMREIYSSNHSGWSKHIQMIDLLVLKTLPDLYSHFCQNNIKMDMFCTSWLFSLFGMMIPLESMGLFFDNVFKADWGYIYRLILAFLIYNQELLLSEDMTGIISLLSSQNYKINTEEELTINWPELLMSAWNIDINNNFVKEMHEKYQLDEQRFRV